MGDSWDMIEYYTKDDINDLRFLYNKMRCTHDGLDLFIYNCLNNPKEIRIFHSHYSRSAIEFYRNHHTDRIYIGFKGIDNVNIYF